MTRSQAVRQAMDKYVDIWGIDWVKERAKHIGSESCNRPDGLYEFRLVNWTEPPDEFYPDGLPVLKIGGESKPNHRTQHTSIHTHGYYSVRKDMPRLRYT